MIPFKMTPDHIFVKTPFNQKDLVKEVLNGVWSKAENMYRFPKNIHVMRELLTHFPQLQYSEEFITAGRQLKAVIEQFINLKKLEDAQGDVRLRPYQRVDVQYLKKMNCAGIFNEPRTGKTPTSIILTKELETKKNLIIAPASLVLNWKKEFERWYPECKVFVVQGDFAKRVKTYSDFGWSAAHGNPSVLLISKDTWKQDCTKEGLDLNDILFDICFVDEAHYLRNYNTAQSEAIFQVESTRKYALTGTPSIKHSKDIFGILKFLYPKKFTSYWQFIDRYFQVQQTKWAREIGNVKPDRVEELQQLIGFLSVQRKRMEVMSWLPEKQFITMPVEFDKKQQKVYDQMLEDFMVQVDEDNLIDTANVLAQLMRLRQLCLDPRLLGLDIPGAKTKALVEWLDDNREPVVIMSMFTSYFDLLKPEVEKLGLKVGMIHGKMSNAQKEQSKVDFQSGKIDVLLCNIISAGVGFTLDRAKVIIFTDKAWNPAENEQAEDRITPTTKDSIHSHEVVTFEVLGTVDERINQILAAKKSLTEAVNEGGREAIRKLMGV